MSLPSLSLRSTLLLSLGLITSTALYIHRRRRTRVSHAPVSEHEALYIGVDGGGTSVDERGGKKGRETCAWDGWMDGWMDGDGDGDAECEVMCCHNGMI